jgi:hypothetical protein
VTVGAGETERGDNQKLVGGRRWTFVFVSTNSPFYFHFHHQSDFPGQISSRLSSLSLLSMATKWLLSDSGAATIPLLAQPT